MNLIINARESKNVTVLELKGKLALGAVEALNEKVKSLIDSGHRALLLDCSQVSSIDSQGIRVLVRGVVSLQQKGGKLKLLRISPFVREVLGITRLLDVIETFDDEAAALQSFTL